ncbi:MAG: hypothetical protein GX575_29075 [Candidatus Anammoximicrobium sp.]|nr:hypothetical protein [Candidatus Anammoximicrobium sp.]
MAVQERDLEAIVCEVLRRLQQLGDGFAPVAAGTRTEDQALAEPAAQRCAAGAGQLPLAERTITMELVQGRLDGVNQVLVPAGAVVTPSVRDELRKRQIVLQTAGDRAAVRPFPAGLVLGVAGRAVSSAAAAAAVRAELGAAERIDDECVLEVVRQVTQAVAAQSRIGLVLTDLPAVALCLANRHAGIRAAWGVNATAVREAMQLIGANLLVVKPAPHGVQELRAMIRAFVSGRHDCPESYRHALGGEP